MALNIAGVRIGRVPQAELDRMLDEARQADVNYDHVGSTLTGVGATADTDADSNADGGHLRRETRTLGHGEAAFAEAVKRLRTWAPQRNIGAPVHPADAPLEVGTTLLVELRCGPLTVVAPDRVMVVVDEPGRRFGFAYGTLPGHAEQGEESFVIELAATGEVLGTVTVDASPGTVAARLATPLVYAIQRWAVRRYLNALMVT